MCTLYFSKIAQSNLVGGLLPFANLEPLHSHFSAARLSGMEQQSM